MRSAGGRRRRGVCRMMGGGVVGQVGVRVGVGVGDIFFLRVCSGGMWGQIRFLFEFFFLVRGGGFEFDWGGVLWGEGWLGKVFL